MHLAVSMTIDSPRDPATDLAPGFGPYSAPKPLSKDVPPLRAALFSTPQEHPAATRMGVAHERHSRRPEVGHWGLRTRHQPTES